MSIEEEGLSLSKETLRALKEFAQSSGINYNDNSDDEEEDDKNGKSIIKNITKHFDVKDKYDIFHLLWENQDIKIELHLKGIKRELGQTLASTGLTIWTAAEYLCDFVFTNPSLFRNLSVCELGCGLGMVSILLAKLAISQCVVATDGDDDTLILLQENINQSECIDKIAVEKLYWGIEEHITNISEKHLLSYNKTSFDVLIAADVVYEVEQIEPLISTACSMLSKTGAFYLSFYPRNVPVDRVIECATAKGLVSVEIVHKWSIPRKGAKLEKIFKIQWRE